MPQSLKKVNSGFICHQKSMRFVIVGIATDMLELAVTKFECKMVLPHNIYYVKFNYLKSWAFFDQQNNWTKNVCTTLHVSSEPFFFTKLSFYSSVLSFLTVVSKLEYSHTRRIILIHKRAENNGSLAEQKWITVSHWLALIVGKMKLTRIKMKGKRM